MPRIPLTPNIQEVIDELPGGQGWWDDDCKRSVERVAAEMIEAEVQERQIIEWLTHLYEAAIGESGVSGIYDA